MGVEAGHNDPPEVSVTQQMHLLLVGGASGRRGVLLCGAVAWPVGHWVGAQYGVTDFFQVLVLLVADQIGLTELLLVAIAVPLHPMNVFAVAHSVPLGLMVVRLTAVP